MITFAKLKYEVFFLFFWVFLIAGIVIWVRTTTVKNTYQYVETQKEVKMLEQEIQLQRVKWLKLTSTKRLETLAATMGLGAPRLEQIAKLQIHKK